MIPLPPLYRDEKGTVIFPPNDPEKPHPLDLHRVVERGGHNAASAFIVALRIPKH